MRRGRSDAPDAQGVRSRFGAGLPSGNTLRRSPALSRRAHTSRPRRLKAVGGELRAVDRVAAISGHSRNVAGCALGTFAEKMPFHLLREIIASFLVREVQPVFIDQHFLVLEPLLPRLLRDVVVNAAAEL